MNKKPTNKSCLSSGELSAENNADNETVQVQLNKTTCNFQDQILN